MCECGCISNDDRYTFPAPKKGMYVLTLSQACTNCVAPSGVTIELIESSHPLYKQYKRGDFTRGQLPFEKWPDCKRAAIICGLLRGEFVEAALGHLFGVDSRQLGDDGVIDEIGAEVILDEMYEDVQVHPRLVTQVNRA